MSITARIAHDIACMREYFRKLSAFAQSSENSFVTTSIECSAEAQFLPSGIAHLVRPDMACNVYSLVDFWLGNLCVYHQLRGALPTTFDEFKKTKKAKGAGSDLHRYAKYLSEIASLDLSAHQSHFDGLDALREVRNILIHTGGHVPSNKRIVIERIPDISIHASLVVVTEPFIWYSLDQANEYLQGVAKGQSPI